MHRGLFDATWMLLTAWSCAWMVNRLTTGAGCMLDPFGCIWVQVNVNRIVRWWMGCRILVETFTWVAKGRKAVKLLEASGVKGCGWERLDAPEFGCGWMPLDANKTNFS